MPEAGKKQHGADDKGFLLFPREWEGTHEAFPELPPQLDTRSPLLPSNTAIAFGALGGAIWNGVRALRRKPLHHAVLNGIGLFTIPFTAINFVSYELHRKAVLPDVKAILKADGIELPKRRYIKAVNAPTIDAMTVSSKSAGRQAGYLCSD